MAKRKNRRVHRKAEKRARRRQIIEVENAQLAGEIPTVPVEALRPEAVSPSAQEDQPMPRLVERAIRCGWAVPEDRKPQIVDEMLKIIDNPDGADKVKIAAFNALRQADQVQYERDHPEAGKAAGPTVLNVVEVVVGGNDRADVAEAAALPPE